MRKNMVSLCSHVGYVFSFATDGERDTFCNNCSNINKCLKIQDKRENGLARVVGRAKEFLHKRLADTKKRQKLL